MIIRNHLKIFYDELWSDMLDNQYGIKVKPNVIRHVFSWTDPKVNLNKGFKIQKPKEFIKIDRYCIHVIAHDQVGLLMSEIVTLADNRMKMGDYRYGFIIRQDLDKYDTIKEFHNRSTIAYKTENLEYVVDAYNMMRIQYYKSKEWLDFHRLFLSFIQLLVEAYEKDWDLISIDDGIHAKEN